MDLNIDHYTPQEMIEFLGLNDVTADTIQVATQELVDKYSTNPQVVNFIQELEKRLMDHLSPNVGRVYVSEIKRGTINPDTKNIVTRVIALDSGLRNGSFTSTDTYTCKLTEKITNVISITLLSVEIPTSWYTFADNKGTARFIYAVSDNEPSTIQLPDGNYTVSALLNTIRDLVQVVDSTFDYTYDAVTGRVTFLSAYTFTMVFYDRTFTGIDTATINQNMGKMLGFTSPLYTSNTLVGATGSTGMFYVQSEGAVNVSGTKYILLEVNDFSSNRLNHNMVMMKTIPNLIAKPPDYHGIPRYRDGDTVKLLPNYTLTKTQTLSANFQQPIVSNRHAYPNETANLFAKIPVKRTGWATSTSTPPYQVMNDTSVSTFTEMTGTLQQFTRDYFGPITLSSIELALYDDKGYTLGLNNADWSCTLLVKSVYQY